MTTTTEHRMLTHIVSGCTACLAAVDTLPYGIAELQTRAGIDADSAVRVYARSIAGLAERDCATMAALNTEAAS